MVYPYEHLVHASLYLVQHNLELRHDKLDYAFIPNNGKVTVVYVCCLEVNQIWPAIHVHTY